MGGLEHRTLFPKISRAGVLFSKISWRPPFSQIVIKSEPPFFPLQILILAPQQKNRYAIVFKLLQRRFKMDLWEIRCWRLGNTELNLWEIRR